MNQIVWLASYPKSGNTWLRALLANYRRDDGQPADINDLRLAPITSSRWIFDELMGIEAADLSPEEIECYRPAVYRQWATESAESCFIKIHDAYTWTACGEPLVPSEVSQGAIYILRNPLDVAVSWSYHSCITLDEAIVRMVDANFSFAASARELPQRLLSWSAHGLSWVEQQQIPVQVIRYEDLLANPAQVFADVLRFIGWSSEPQRVIRAVEHAAFENLQAQERAHGFREKPAAMQSFFRAGRAGGWRLELNAAQVARVIQDHALVMRRFGYLHPNAERDELRYPTTEGFDRIDAEG